MIYFEYPLDIHGWKPKPETKPKPELENRGRKTNSKPETRKTETCGYPHRTRSTAISNLICPILSKSKATSHRHVHRPCVRSRTGCWLVARAWNFF